MYATKKQYAMIASAHGSHRPAKRPLWSATSAIRSLAQTLTGRKQQQEIRSNSGDNPETSSMMSGKPSTADDTSSEYKENSSSLLSSARRRDSTGLEQLATFWSEASQAVRYSNDDREPLIDRLRCEFPEIQAYLGQEDSINFPLPDTDFSSSTTDPELMPYDVRTRPIDLLSPETHTADLQGLATGPALENLQEMVYHTVLRSIRARGLPEEMLDGRYITSRMIGVVGPNDLLQQATGFGLQNMVLADQHRSREVEDGTLSEYTLVRSAGRAYGAVTLRMTDL